MPKAFLVKQKKMRMANPSLEELDSAVDCYRQNETHPLNQPKHITRETHSSPPDAENVGKQMAECKQQKHTNEERQEFPQHVEEKIFNAEPSTPESNDFKRQQHIVTVLCETEKKRSENYTSGTIPQVTLPRIPKPAKVNTENIWRPFASYANIFTLSSRLSPTLLAGYKTLYGCPGHPSVAYSQDCLSVTQNYQHSQNGNFIYHKDNNYDENESIRHEHILRNEQGQGKFACEICGSAFPLQRLLSRHLKSHSFYKRYQCQFCGKGFNDTFDLKRHIRTHTGIKPFKCSHCEKSFTQRCSLEAHLTRVHGVVLKFGFRERRSKMYVCEDCGQTFRENSQFIKHTAAHHPENDDKMFKFRTNGFP